MSTKKPSWTRGVYTLRSKDQAIHSPHRLVMFIDAILAIAATLLILNLHVSPDTALNGLASQLRHQVANFVSILLGFLWITGTWVLSHRQIRQLRGVNYYMTLYIVANVLTATLIPYASNLLAEGYGHPDFWVGVEAVSVVILISTMLSVLQSRYAIHQGLLLSPPPPRASGSHRPIALIIWYVVVALSVISVIVAPLSPWLAFGIIVTTRISALMPLASDRKGLPGDIDLAE